MQLWIPITIAAAFFQNLRSALQRQLRGQLSTLGAAYARFVYALPIALAYLAALHYGMRLPLPKANLAFAGYVLLGAISQILFTVVLLWLFSFRNFAVGTTFSKLEVVMVAALGALLLGDSLGLAGAFAVGLSTLGVISLTMDESRLTLRALLAGLGEKATLIGLLSAATLGASVVFFRGAALALEHDSATMAAGFTFTIAVALQTALMGAWLRLAEPGQLSAILTHWRRAAPAGIAGGLGSIGWFTAFTLQNAAYVRALGQVELVFTFLWSVFVFRERVHRLEVLGILLIVVAILVLLLAE